jgi:iron(III) transport system substrate-binding protein
MRHRKTDCSRRKIVNRFTRLGLLILFLLVALPAGLAAAPQTRVLNLYSARHYDTDETLFDGFMAKTGIKVNLIEGGEDQLIERMKAEGRNSPADVLITVDAGRLWRAEEAGLFQKISSPVLNTRLPASLRDPNGYWYGFAMRVRVIAYARNRINPAQLSTYEDLADPKWRGKLLVRSSSHVYNQSLVGALIAVHGGARVDQWARGIVANFARQPQGGDSDQIKGVAAGEGDLAVINHYYYARLLNSSRADERGIAEKVGLFYPNQGPGQRGVHVNISGGGVVATAPNRESAIAFLEYLASDDAQRLFARGSFEYPAVASVPKDPSILGLRAFRADPLNARTYGANNQQALQLMLRAGWR